MKPKKRKLKKQKKKEDAKMNRPNHNPAYPIMIVTTNGGDEYLGRVISQNYMEVTLAPVIDIKKFEQSFQKGEGCSLDVGGVEDLLHEQRTSGWDKSLKLKLTGVNRMSPVTMFSRLKING